MQRNQEEEEKSNVVRVLQQTILFAGVPGEDLEPLAADSSQRIYAVRQPIVRADCDEGLLVVERGALRLFRSGDAGNEVTLGTFPAGAVLGVSPSAATVMAASTLEALERHTVVRVLPQQQVEGLLRRSPELVHRMMEYLGQYVATLCGRVEELALHPVRARLAHELGSRAQANGQHEIHTTHEELAAWIGSSQIEVSRALRALRAEGLIRSTPHRRGIRVLDPGKLAGY